MDSVGLPTAESTFDTPISNFIWNEKYRHRGPGDRAEQNKADSMRRVAHAVFENDKHPEVALLANECFNAMVRGDWVPAGRIHAGAGTGRRVTLINCFVSPIIQDSMETEPGYAGVGIMDALKAAAISQQMGGGIGMDFSTLRPLGAIVQRTGSVSDGPLKFMDMWNSMCGTIMSSGSRRGAMMATLRDDHPDILSFIEAKHQEGRLTNFNVSVLVSDALMKAVRNDDSWELGFRKPRADGKHISAQERNGELWYVYERVSARRIWERIIHSTYTYAEPGVIFIDRVNARNPLYYCEDIRCTNPCGEQPLPPNGACNLGAINLATMVHDPFGLNPQVDFGRIKATATLGVRFLDNVLDVSHFPTAEQKAEAVAKRRIGLGITGLGNMLQQMKLRYGSEPAIQVTKRVMETIRDAAYRASIKLADERGHFPAFEVAKHCSGEFAKTLPNDIRQGMMDFGLRNGVLLTIAPTGTTSIYYGNVSSGCEPTYDWRHFRKVLKADNTFEELEVEDYGHRLYRAKYPKNGKGMPDFMVTALDLTVRDHVVMQAACQEFVDASISKTINCPENMSFDEFQSVYTMAYDCGLKGCTTYRPDPDSGRGAVLSTERQSSKPVLAVRPPELDAKVYKVKAPGMEHAMYVTIADRNVGGQRRPHEIFVNTKAAVDRPWTDALTRTMSAVMRVLDGDVAFLAEELKQVHSATGGFWDGPRFIPSLPAMIGTKLEHHLQQCGLIQVDEQPTDTSVPVRQSDNAARSCPKCSAKAYVYTEGCWRCQCCGHSSCG